MTFWTSIDAQCVQVKNFIEKKGSLTRQKIKAWILVKIRIHS